MDTSDLPEPDPLLSTRQAARLLGVSPETVIRWILHSGLPAARLPSGRYRLRRSDVLARLERVQGRPAPQLKPRLTSPYAREILRRAGLLRYLDGEGPA